MATIYEIVQAHYFHEVDRRRDLHASLGIPLGILTAGWAAIFGMLNGLRTPFDVNEWLVLLFSLVAAGLGSMAVYHAISASYGYVYKHPTAMGPLFDWRTGVLNNGNSAIESDRQTTELLTEQYARAADVNCGHNDRKSGHIDLLYWWLIRCLVGVALCAIPYILSRILLPGAHAL